jgi:Cys-rich protein (TIGR01571 family)
MAHLATFHGITPPTEPSLMAPRQWRYGLFEACCSSPAMTCDCAMCYCCTVHRMYRLLFGDGDEEKQGWITSYRPGVQNWTKSWIRYTLCGPVAYLGMCAFSPLVAPYTFCVDGEPTIPCLYESNLREKVCKRHNIDESTCASKLTTLLCCPCAVMQTLRELESIGVWPGTTLFAPQPQVADGWPVPPSVAAVPGLAAAMQRPPFTPAMMM